VNCPCFPITGSIENPLAFVKAGRYLALITFCVISPSTSTKYIPGTKFFDLTARPVTSKILQDLLLGSRIIPLKMTGTG
jgi:hypothetical protein